MRRRFTLQMCQRRIAFEKQTGDEHERESKRLDVVSRVVDFHLGHPEGSASIRHDQANFFCHVGPDLRSPKVADGMGFGEDHSVQRKALIVIERGFTALKWDETEAYDFARRVAVAYREKYSGPPLQERDGNRPRPVKETHTTTGNRDKPIRGDV